MWFRDFLFGFKDYDKHKESQRVVDREESKVLPHPDTGSATRKHVLLYLVLRMRENLSMAVSLVNKWRCFGGFQQVLKHTSKVLKCEMTFAVYLPPQAEDGNVPVLYWLSGLTCSEQNFIQKAGAQRYAAEHGIAIVCPDTSPRGCGIEGEDADWDFGTGAGFYVDATQEKWKTHYNMYSYVTTELPELVQGNFPVDPKRKGICGHSMGGHGALICFLKNPTQYKSVSAFSPICNPSNCPWGEKAFTGYLGSDRESWKQYDACELAKNAKGVAISHILIDQGKSDNFYPHQLLPENFVDACRTQGVPIALRLHEGYDHSYYFIASFIGEHIAHHAKALAST